MTEDAPEPADLVLKMMVFLGEFLSRVTDLNTDFLKAIMMAVQRNQFGERGWEQGGSSMISQ